MESTTTYQTNTPAIIGQEQEIENQRYWYHNGAAIAALALLLNTIALGWASLFIESSWTIKLMIISLFFTITLGANAKVKNLS